MNEKSGKIQTVLGLLDKAQIGVTLAHEHIFIDMARRIPGPFKPLLSRFRKMNLDKAISEVSLFKESGGSTIIDVTPEGLEIDDMQAKIATVSRATGINLVCGTGYYTGQFWNKKEHGQTVEEIAATYIRHIEDGFGDTGIKAGVIGEIGVSWPMLPSETRYLRAAAIASIKTGVPISIHSGFHKKSPTQIVTFLLDQGVPPDNIILGHMDIAFSHRHLEEMLEFASLGSFCVFDGFGKNLFQSLLSFHPTWTDALRIETIKKFIEKGFGNRILVSTDMVSKGYHVSNGGHGYTYIPKYITSLMASKGISPSAIKAIMVDNPATAFSII